MQEGEEGYLIKSLLRLRTFKQRTVTSPSHSRLSLTDWSSTHVQLFEVSAAQTLSLQVHRQSIAYLPVCKLCHYQTVIGGMSVNLISNKTNYQHNHILFKQYSFLISVSK